MEFLKTKEYKRYRLCVAAVEAVPTYNNLSKYWKCMEDLINLSKVEYDNIGLTNNQEYCWIQKLKIPDRLYQKYKHDGKGGYK